MKIIRRANESDHAELMELYQKDIQADEKLAERFAEDLIYKMKTLVCVEEEEIVGTVSWQVRGGLEDGVIELIGLGVDPEFRREGTATKLVDVLIRDANAYYESQGFPLRFIYLFMRAGNENARAFYRNMGFTEVSEVPDMFPHDHGILWTKLLSV
ncbi:GNAT family N-acetyltransferase [Candidatus Thorarchaeota archaeon]|nr:MAG: GNAT family N-acetyltransferase [Candidatus Thorarchaeota archaeon]